MTRITMVYPTAKNTRGRVPVSGLKINERRIAKSVWIGAGPLRRISDMMKYLRILTDTQKIG